MNYGKGKIMDVFFVEPLEHLEFWVGFPDTIWAPTHPVTRLHTIPEDQNQKKGKLSERAEGAVHEHTRQGMRSRNR